MPFYRSKQILCFCDHCRNHEMTHDWVCMQFLYSLSSFIHFRKWAYAIKNFLLSVPTKSFEWLRLLGPKETAVHLNRKQNTKKKQENAVRTHWTLNEKEKSYWLLCDNALVFTHLLDTLLPLQYPSCLHRGSLCSQHPFFLFYCTWESSNLSVSRK